MDVKQICRYYNQPFIERWNGIINYSTKYKQKVRAEFGKLHEVVDDELVNICKDKRLIVIYGHTKSGKVLIGKLLSERLNRKLIISDDYKDMGWIDNMYHIKEMLKRCTDSIIVEGVQSGRLLRKGVEEDDLFADLVIHLEINRASLKSAYIRDGESEKLKNDKIFNFNKNVLDKIFFEWYRMNKNRRPDKMPEIININTSYVEEY